MKNKFVFVYSILASVSILFAVAFLSFNLVKEYQNSSKKTQTRFEQIQKRINFSLENPQYENSLFSGITKQLNESNDISYLVISQNEKTVFVYPGNLAQKPNSPLIKQMYNSFYFENSVISVDFGLFLISPQIISFYTKISFLIILIVTILSLLVILFANFKNENSVTDDENSEEEIEIDTKIEVEKTNEIEKSEQDENLNQISNDEQDEKTKENENIEQNDVLEQIEEIGEPTESSLKIEDSGENSPKGLFSPITGLGWENYLLTRLDNELNRAIASEIDMSVFIFQLENLNRQSEIFTKICDYLCVQFQFNDLVFEYKEDCIVAIMLNMDLDTSLNFADNLLIKINDELEQTNSKCFIGISTRSIRMISGERILNEAEQALLHAKEDKDSQIIAFRVNTEKYLKYLESNS